MLSFKPNTDEEKKKKERFKLYLTQIMDKCNKGDKYQDILENGTPNKQHEMAKCLVSGMGFLMKKPVKMAETLFKAAADKGHLDSAYEFYILS